MYPSIDHEIHALIKQELVRQENQISLIASENYAPENILKAVGSVLTNKYAEGLPGKRYYAGCAIVDAIEECAIDRAKKLFNTQYVNVQPHSGSQANMAVFMALLKPGDTILGMDLAAGGHLTHGHSANFSGTLYKVISYGVDKYTEHLDYDAIKELAFKHRPKLIIAGSSSYSQIIDFEKFSEIAKTCGSFLVADIAHIAGLVATGLHPSPIEHADFVTSTTHKTLRGPRGAFVMCKQEHASILDKSVMPGIQGGPFMHAIAGKAICFGNAMHPDFVEYSRQIIVNAQAMAKTFKDLGYHIIGNGTQNHMFVIDLRSIDITGKEAEQILENIGITTTRSCIPNDPQKPYIGTGLRIGTPAITTRNFKEDHALELAMIIHTAFKYPAKQQSLAQQVHRLAQEFPIYAR